MTSSPNIALLRGINVGGRNRVPMAELSSLCQDLGWSGVRTYIQSGNVVFSAAGPRAALERALEEAISNRLDLDIAVIVRTAADWERYCTENPFDGAAETEPNRVVLALSKEPPRPGSAEALMEKATLGERVVSVGDALLIHYAGGIGRSKITPALLDRRAGSPVTGRSWRTVLKLRELIGAATSG